MVRIVLLATVLVTQLGACTPRQAPKARMAGEAMSLGGVAGLVGTALLSGQTRDEGYFVGVFSLMSLVGIATFASGELATPEPIRETLPERNQRWATILSGRAGGAAREGRCRRVRRLERRILHLDREVHDFVLMKDGEVLRCLREYDPVPADAPSAMKPIPSPPSPPPPTIPPPTDDAPFVLPHPPIVIPLGE